MAIWYAQLAATDVSAANQWNAAPDGSGAWLTWANLGAADVLCANGKTSLYISSGFTCGSITTSGGGIGADGGGFIVASGVTPTITCAVVAGTSPAVTSYAGRTLTITGAVTGGRGANAFGAVANGAGAVVSITGAVTGGSAYGAQGAFATNAGAITITGAVTGGSANNAFGASATNAGAITITGAVTGGSYQGAYGAFAQNAGAAVSITGNVTGGSAATAFGAYAATAGTITINGTVTAGATWSAYGAFCNDASGSLTIVGSIINSNTGGPGVAGLYYWQPASVAHYWQVAWNGSYNFRYTLPPLAQNVREGVQRGYMLEFPDYGTLQIPAEADVKAGVGYGGSGTEYTGTLVAGGGGVPLIGPGGLVG